jgi:hypothetical protein
MNICKNCGVELEPTMTVCPLCREAIGNKECVTTADSDKKNRFIYGKKMSPPEKKFTWEIVSLILLSAIAATLVIDCIINKTITWSEYPVAISLTVFSYLSLFTFWPQHTTLQLAGGLIVSTLLLLLLDTITNGINWSIKLGIPLILAATFLTAIFIKIIHHSTYKGINLIAYGFLGVAIFCVFIDGILFFNLKGIFHVDWSLLVVACTIPVVLVLLFVHFRMKKGRSLKRTFHI